MTLTTANSLLDLRSGSNHPLSLRYSEIFQAALLEGRFEHGRAQPGLALSGETPFVIAARKAVEFGLHQPEAIEVIVASLTEYYLRVRPANAAAWLGLENTGSALLLAAPPWGAVFPWRARTQASYQQAYEAAAIAENRVVGREAGVEEGWLFCGPVSPDKVRIEGERILYVLQQIETKGYQRADSSDGDVKATALVNDNQEWRWLITAGNHRAAAAVALGYDSIPVRINLVISRVDARWWKHVVEGTFQLHEAQQVFDTLFNGQAIPAVQQWLNGKS